MAHALIPVNRCIYSNKDKNFKANHNYQKCNGDYCMLYL